MRGFLGVLASLVTISLVTWGEDANRAKPPRFEDYPVTEQFAGKPVAPILATSGQWTYRTRIREGVSNGVGVERNGKDGQPGPNFAGHYIIITFPCGSPCIVMVMVDAITGKVYSSPMGEGVYMSLLGGGPWLPIAKYQVNSRLLIMEPCPNLAPEPVYTHYFVWENHRWKLIRKILLETDPPRP